MKSPDTEDPTIGGILDIRGEGCPRPLGYGYSRGPPEDTLEQEGLQLNLDMLEGKRAAGVDKMAKYKGKGSPHLILAIFLYLLQIPSIVQKLSFHSFTMAHTKRTIKRESCTRKRAKSVEGVKFASSSSSLPPSPYSARPVVGLLSPRPSLDKAMYNALSPLLDQWIMQRIANLVLGPKFLMRLLGCLYFSGLSKWSCLPLLENFGSERGAALEHLKGEALEQELQDLCLQVSNHPWDLALLEQDLRKAQAERDVDDRSALAAR
ncbi:hypothetical protein LIER_16893 [Lithospermum erythrorhizon]|uniref:Uncharacterized protein n=1 Tax=Lithospermum erythrorhizon TaxID=34254 RepID=A0AAV3QBL2_LITER